MTAGKENTILNGIKRIETEKGAFLNPLYASESTPTYN